MVLNGKRVLVVGLGKSGVASALFLKSRGARVTVSDSKPEAELRNEILLLLEHGIAVETGGHGERTFRGQDLIVVSPGVPVDAPQLVQARKLGETVIGEIELAAQFLAGSIVAITGANGKTTTTSLAGEIIAAGNFPTSGGRKYRHAGNQFCRSSPSPVHGWCLRFRASNWKRSCNLSAHCGRAEHHSGPSRPPQDFRKLRERQGANLRESRCRTISPF